MSIPLAKRRKLEAQSALSKPFKPPLRLRREEGSEDDTIDIQKSVSQHNGDKAITKISHGTAETKLKTDNVQNSLYQEEPQSLQKASQGVSKDRSETLPELKTEIANSSDSETPLSAPATPHVKSLKSDECEDKQLSHQQPEAVEPTISNLRALSSQQAVLTNQLLAKQRELDTAKQALSLLQSNRDRELEELISTWRDAARAAAEEVLEGARDRVNSLGGVGAWREKERMRVERMKSWEEAGPGGSEDEGEDEDEEDEDEEAEKDEFKRQERGELKKEKRELRERLKEEMAEAQMLAEKEEAERESEKPQSEEEHDAESFTMGMLLRSLNIDFDVIGYDNHNQRWID